MILEIIFLLTTLALGVISSESWFPSKEWTSLFCKTIVLSIIIQSFEAFALNYALNNWNYFLIIGILVNGIIAFIYRKKFVLKKEFEWRKIALFIIMFLELYSLYHHGMNVQGTTVTSSYPVWGDALFHFGIMNNFIEKSNTERSLEYPIYSGAKLSYPFLIDYHFYLFVNSGVNPYYFFLFFAVLMNAILFFLMLEFMKILCKDRIKNVLVICLILFTSSLGIFFLFNGNISDNYSIPSTNGIFAMTPMILTDLYPRRSANLVYPLFFMFLISIVTGDFDRLIKTKNKIWIGILIGLTSFFEVHFTLIMILLLALKWLLNRNRDIFKITLIALAFFLPNFLWINTSGSISNIKLQSGFFSTSFSGLFVTLAVNLLPLLLPLIFGLFYYKKLDDNNKLFLLFGATIFLLANFIQFHAWNWDNIKFLRYAQFALIPILLLKFNKKILLLFVIVFSLSGISTIMFYHANTYEFVSQDRIDFANYIKNNTSPTEIILTNNEPDNPAVYLAGRKTLAGGEGWLWSHGLPYKDRFYDLKELIEKGRFKEIKNKYGVQYYSTSEGTSSNELKLLYEKAYWKFYKIK